MLVDRYGKNVEVGDWFIRLDQNDEGRLYKVIGYPEAGRILVHEHDHIYDESRLYRDRLAGIAPKRKQQNIQMPRRVIWYPESLLPKIIAPANV